MLRNSLPPPTCSTFSALLPYAPNYLEEIEAAPHTPFDASLWVSKSLVGKVHAPLASRLSIKRIMATVMNVSLLCTIRS